ncbi:MAG: class I tRNA ligase family protein, partial [Oscillospiraceae bacterium]|nr:class I tRNA ligase family protein [Oscillospiraceae bacterium]
CGSEQIERDPDVLDTWFSSALWPFSTLGWPDKTPELEYFYPTSVLVTGYDIIFFWVARMIFSGCEQMKKFPFEKVLIHGLVRDSKGRKMSKSLGNGIDPLEIADKYGADALRFNLITGNSPGNDMRFYTEKCEAMRNFANKIWNASRFVMMNLTIEKVRLPEKLELEDKWVLSKLNTLVKEVTENMDAYELGVASAKVYDFIWDTYCDWYIELTKGRMQDPNTAENAQNVLCYVFIQLLKLLHPFMPFITEEIYQALPHIVGETSEFLMLCSWPVYDEKLIFTAEESAMETVMDAIRAIRTRRAEMNVAPGRRVQLTIAAAQQETFQAGAAFFKRLASASEVHVVSASEIPEAKGMVEVVTHAARVFMPLAELVDVQQELERIAKEKAKAEGHLKGIEAKLNNEAFTSKAPAHIVQNQRDQAEKLRALIAQLEQSAAAMQ